jgi:hypothetical protein
MDRIFYDVLAGVHLLAAHHRIFHSRRGPERRPTKQNCNYHNAAFHFRIVLSL